MPKSCARRRTSSLCAARDELGLGLLASTSRRTIAPDGLRAPDSYAAMLGRATPDTSASSACVSPARSRASLISSTQPNVSFDTSIITRGRAAAGLDCSSIRVPTVSDVASPPPAHQRLLFAAAGDAVRDVVDGADLMAAVRGPRVRRRGGALVGALSACCPTGAVASPPKEIDMSPCGDR